MLLDVLYCGMRYCKLKLSHTMYFHTIITGMYWIAIFKIQPEPDSTGYQMNYPDGTGTGYLNTC